MMRRFVCLLLIALWPGGLAGADHAPRINAVLDGHILPGFSALANMASSLDVTARETCDIRGDQAALRAAYHQTFDAWMAVSHLRFGPSEVDNRAFALAFWPDTKGFTPKALRALMAAQDPVVGDPDGFASVSIAGRGLLALEFLLFDPAFSAEDSAYRCALLRAIAHDINRSADAILSDWQKGYAAALRRPGETGPYRDQQEVVRELYKAFGTGLQFSADARLGRPLGTLEKARPRRAEAWRSARSRRNLVQSLKATRALGDILAREYPEVHSELMQAFDQTIAAAEALDDPAFGDVSTMNGRFRIEGVQSRINHIRDIAAERLGPALGVGAGFNALDGD